MRKLIVVTLATVLGLPSARSAAGPPLATDDPETPGRRGWEINLSNNIERTKSELLMESPLVDINYGLRENDQWKIEFAVIYLDRDDRGSGWGVGDLLLGWKYRFFEEDDFGLSASIYPQVLAPTGNARWEFGSGHPELLLPIQVGLRFAANKVFLYGEVGYDIVFGEPESNFWKYGVAVEWQVHEKIEVMGEVGGLIFPRDADPDDIFFNLGIRYDLSESVAFIGSAGRSFRHRDIGAPEFASFVGVQITWAPTSDAE
jgi:hypothetical protein